MDVRQFIPCTQLSDYVRRYLIVESATGMENVLLPDTAPAMAFRLKGNTSQFTNDSHTALSFATISGLRSKPRKVSYAGKSAMLIVLFNPIGISSFLSAPLQATFGETVDLQNLVDHESINKLEDQLGAIKDDRHRITCIENFLLSILKPKDDVLVSMAILEILNKKGTLKVSELPSKLSISIDAFEKRFRKNVGATPKQFARIVRLRSVINNRHQTSSLTDIALGAGYFDQSHFIHEFKTFTGQTPTIFFASGPRW